MTSVLLGKAGRGREGFMSASLGEKFGQIRTGVWQRHGYGGYDDGSILGHSSSSGEGAQGQDRLLQESRVR